MPWLQITFDVPDELKDAVMGELSEHAPGGIWESEVPLSGQTRIVAYFDSSSNLDSVRRGIDALFERANLKRPSIFQDLAQDRDWMEEWKKTYTSFPIGRDFFVVPSWSDSTCPDDRLPIRIDPGQAFGTGTHETTQLTMELMERWVEPDQVILDLGTGSGILAIAARLLGARRIVAGDIDPDAMRVALANIKRNVNDSVWTYCGSVDPILPGSIDLLLCNLTADVIIQLFDGIDGVVRPGGIAIFSGVLVEQRDAVVEVLTRSGYGIHEETTRGEWIALATQKSAGHGD